MVTLPDAQILLQGAGQPTPTPMPPENDETILQDNHPIIILMEVRKKNRFLLKF